MRIGFVGKWGSGKSSIAASFIQALRQDESRALLVADADINQHLHVLLGQAKYPSLNNPTTFDRLRRFVRWTSQRIREDHHVIRTTPPSDGTGTVTLSSTDPLLAETALWDGNVAYVSTGEPIQEHHGTKCYHNNLVPLEILLNHLSEGDGIVLVDTVAWVDAFSTSMHIQFDALCLITEPSAESVGVAHEYLSMARDHSIEDRVMVVANQMESPDDEAYLHTQGLSPVASVPFIRDMRCVVREQGMLDLDSLSELASAANRLVGTIMKNIIPMTTEERYRRLSELHRIQAEKKHHPATRDELLWQIG